MNAKLSTPEDITYRNNTGDKTAELSLFYNLALDRINNLISFYEEKSVQVEKLDLENADTHFKPDTYLQLKVYLWKEEVSGRYAQVNEEDRKILNLFLKKLVDLRNFHSHYYHESNVLLFPKQLSEKMKWLFEKSKKQLVEKNPSFQKYIDELEIGEVKFKRKDGSEGVDKYLHFKFFEADGTITPEGKNLFLSFFLLKGEMSKFLKKRPRSKKDNGEKYQVKARLLTYYCHRDGSNRFFLSAKKDYYDENELLKRQFNTILNYLKTKPVVDKEYLPPTKEMPLYSRSEMEQRKESRKQNKADIPGEPHEVIRRKSKFIEFAIRYIMDIRKLETAENNIDIEWAVIKYDDYKETKKINADKIENKDNQSYFGVPVYWKSNFEPGCFPIIKNNHARFRLANEKSIEYIINEQEFKNWLYFILRSSSVSLDVFLLRIEELGKQYKDAMMELKETNNISFTKYPLVFGVDGSDKRILSEMHTKILENKKFNEPEYRDKIRKRIETTIDFLEKELVHKDTYLPSHKNRTILKCFNWYLPLNAKLKPNEVNMVSIYNFVSGSPMKPETRSYIIKPVITKLSKASEGAFNLVQSASTLDGLYVDIIKKKIASLKDEIKRLNNYSISQLHVLAGKLSVSLPGADVSRNNKPRLEELKATIARKPVLIPNGFFKKNFAPAERNTVSTLIKNKWQGLLIEENYKLHNQNRFINGDEGILFKKDISAEVLNIVEQQYDRKFQEFSERTGQKFSDFVNLFLVGLNDKTPVRNKEIVKALNLYKALNEIKVKDALLAKILFKYHNKIVLPVKNKMVKNEPANISGLFEYEYEFDVGNGQKFKIGYKQLDDLATFWDKGKIKRLLNNKKYWSETILKELEKNGKKSDQEKILILMNNVFMDSYYYLATFLNVEKKVLDEFRKSLLQQFIAESMHEVKGGERIEPKVLLKKLEHITKKQIDKFMELRKSAFHTNVPTNDLKYEEEKDELANLAGIEKKQKPDKSKYKMSKFDTRK